MSDQKKVVGREILEEKQRVFAEQEARRMRERPLSDKQSVAYAKELLSTLERAAKPPSPARITMNAPPPLTEDRMPDEIDPEPIGGCFADIENGCST